MISYAFAVRRTSGETIVITRESLEELRHLSDRQLSRRGYDPESVTEACIVADAGKK